MTTDRDEVSVVVKQVNAESLYALCILQSTPGIPFPGNISMQVLMFSRSGSAYTLSDLETWGLLCGYARVGMLAETDAALRAKPLVHNVHK